MIAELIKVTVVITTRNRREMLAKALASVRAQTMTDWELVVVDDASSDGTWAYLQGLDCSGIRVVRQPRQAERSASRNRGMGLARGAYIMFLDDDDLLRPHALEVLSRALDQHPDSVAAVGARADWFVAEGKVQRDFHVRIPRQRVIFDELLLGWSAVSGQVLYRCQLIRELGGYSLAHIPCEDRELWLRVAAQGPVVLRPETTMTYQVHAGHTRPDDILQIRERVARRAIRRMPAHRRRRGLRIRRTTALIDQAEASIIAGHFIKGWALGAAAALSAPRLFASPLVWPWVARKLAGRTWHRLRGRRA